MIILRWVRPELEEILEEAVDSIYGSNPTFS